MNIPSIFDFGKRVYLGALIVLTLAMSTAVVAQKVSDVSPEAQPPNLDQCANGKLPAAPQTCTGSAWQNGNLNENNSQWVEGQFVPYRLIIPNLTVGQTYTVEIQWDTTEGTDHTLDYIGTYNQTNPADPCSGVTCGAMTTFPIPLDPRVAAAGVTQPAGVFTLWGGTITNVSAYQFTGPADYSDTTKAGLVITFTANAETAVLAWSGHISTRLDWGIDNSAISLPGSPYHMRFLGLNGQGGNQDRSMSVASVIFPAVIRVIKMVDTYDGTDISNQIFGFTATNNFLDLNSQPVPNFALQDNGNDLDGTSDTINGAVTDFANPVLIQEGLVNDWSASDVTCTEFDAGLGTGLATWETSIGSTNPLVLPFASVSVEEGAGVVCVFTNQNAAPTAAPASVGGRVTNSTGRGISGVYVTLIDLQSGERVLAVTNSFGYYRFDSIDTETFYMLGVASKRYSFPNNIYTFTLNQDMLNMNFVAAN